MVSNLMMEVAYTTIHMVHDQGHSLLAMSQPRSGFSASQWLPVKSVQQALLSSRVVVQLTQPPVPWQ